MQENALAAEWKSPEIHPFIARNRTRLLLAQTGTEREFPLNEIQLSRK